MIVEHLEINGLWGKGMRLKLHKDVNFLIGVNGSGKTTVINLLAAVLKCDLVALDRNTFSSVTIGLRDPETKATSIIKIERQAASEPPYASAFTYKFDGEGPGMPVLILERGRPLFYRPSAGPRPIDLVKERLRNLVNLTWVSVHRASITRDREEVDVESAVDKKLGQLMNNLIKHFSLLAARGAVETEKFQQSVFLSLLNRLSSEANLLTAVAKLKLDDEESALIQIFENFGLLNESSRQRIEDEFSIVKTVTKSKGRPSLDWSMITAMVGLLRISSLVQDWRKLVARRTDIFSSRDDFLAILRAMMPTKQFWINDKNELAVRICGGAELSLRNLSSGEKQLLIILGEALLQDGTSWVYIADEPELSLHVAWQEQLVSHVRKLNPKAQVIFATHSPDIVAQFEKRVFDMEKLIQ
jgi:predicted ATPase